MKEERRREIIAFSGFTINGERAEVFGTKLDFPIVRMSGYRSFEFSWETLEKSMISDGKLKV